MMGICHLFLIIEIYFYYLKVLNNFIIIIYKVLEEVLQNLEFNFKFYYLLLIYQKVKYFNFPNFLNFYFSLYNLRIFFFNFVK